MRFFKLKDLKVRPCTLDELEEICPQFWGDYCCGARDEGSRLTDRQLEKEHLFGVTAEGLPIIWHKSQTPRDGLVAIPEKLEEIFDYGGTCIYVRDIYQEDRDE